MAQEIAARPAVQARRPALLNLELGPLAVELWLRDVARVRKARGVRKATAEHRWDKLHNENSGHPWYQASTAEALVTGRLFADD